MSEERKAPFIPAWLDDLGLSAAEFRIFCHLCRRADNASGIAWPSYGSMTEACGFGKSTVRRALEELEKRELIAKAGKPFGGSCRYQILSPIVPPQGGLDASNSSITGTIEAAPIVPPQDRNSSTSGPSIVPPEGQEGSPKKVPQGRFPNSFVEDFWNMVPQKGRDRSSKQELRNQLKNLPQQASPELLVESLKAWMSSEDWTKENGQYVPGIHKWIRTGKWECPPGPSPRGSAARIPAERFKARTHANPYNESTNID